MKSSSLKAVSVCLYVAASQAWSTDSSSSSRRTFFTSSASGIVAGGGMLLHTGSIACTCAYCCMGIIPQPANAYENRNVGGDDASPETKAMNRQAYETNNRLERDGFKLDTQAEQSASLKAALSSYTYEPSTSTPPKKDGKRKSK